MQVTNLAAEQLVLLTIEIELKTSFEDVVG